MTKLFFENTDPDAGRAIRIYRLDTLGGIEAPESFTPMDLLGNSVAIDLLPAPLFTCVGVINRAGILELSSEESIEIILANGSGIVAMNIDDLIIQLRELGYTVDVMEEYLPTPVISCVGESNFVGWIGDVNVYGNYELTFNIVDSAGTASTKIVTGYSEFGENLITISNQSPEWPSSVDCNGDGNVRIGSNLFDGGDIRVRFAADQGFSFGAGTVQEGSSTVIESVDASDRDVLEFCLHTESTTS